MSRRPTRREFALFAGAGAWRRTRGRGPSFRSRSPSPRRRPASGGVRSTDGVRRSRRAVPGAALAVARHGRLVYARGFGYADPKARTPVQPDSLFRVASVSKPITGVAVLRLVERGKVKLDDPVRKYLRVAPHLAAGKPPDPRWHAVTVRHCLHHTGGWDSDITPDPSGTPWEIAEALGVTPPLAIDDVVRFMLGRPLDFDPGTRHVYSNFGYLLLGRVIETVSGTTYEDYVRREVLAPLGAGGMRLGRALPQDRTAGEVMYHDTRKRVGPCLYPPRLRETVPLPDGADNFEVYEAHGGWVASAVDLLRFARGFDDPARCPVLSASGVETLFARPEGDAGYEPNGQPRGRYYACGWRVRPNGTGGRPNTWHMGTVWGASAMLVRCGDGVSWAALFNTDSHPSGTKLPDLLDKRIHSAADDVTAWPEGDLFDTFAIGN